MSRTGATSPARRPPAPLSLLPGSSWFRAETILFDGGLGGQALHLKVCCFLLDSPHLGESFGVVAGLRHARTGQVESGPGVQDAEGRVLFHRVGQVFRGPRGLPGGEIGKSDIALFTAKEDGRPAGQYELVGMISE